MDVTHKMKKRYTIIIIFISMWVVIDLCVLFILPISSLTPVNGWVHRARSISFNEPSGIPDMGDLHGLTEEEAAFLSTEAGFPRSGTVIGENPGLDGPWTVWTDWSDDDTFMGKEANDDENIFYDMTSFCYFNVFYTDIPEDGSYYISFGSDDGMILFLDGVRVFEELTTRSCFIDDDHIQKNMTAGRHFFLLIVYQIRSSTGFAFRIKNATLNATHMADPETAEVMLFDYQSSLTSEINYIGLIVVSTSIGLCLAVVMIEYFTRKRI